MLGRCLCEHAGGGMLTLHRHRHPATADPVTVALESATLLPILGDHLIGLPMSVRHGGTGPLPPAGCKEPCQHPGSQPSLEPAWHKGTVCRRSGAAHGDDVTVTYIVPGRGSKLEVHDILLDSGESNVGFRSHWRIARSRGPETLNMPTVRTLLAQLGIMHADVSTLRMVISRADTGGPCFCCRGAGCGHPLCREGRLEMHKPSLFKKGLGRLEAPVLALQVPPTPPTPNLTQWRSFLLIADEWAGRRLIIGPRIVRTVLANLVLTAHFALDDPRHGTCDRCSGAGSCSLITVCVRGRFQPTARDVATLTQTHRDVSSAGQHEALMSACRMAASSRAAAEDQARRRRAARAQRLINGLPAGEQFDSGDEDWDGDRPPPVGAPEVGGAATRFETADHEVHAACLAAPVSCSNLGAPEHRCTHCNALCWTPEATNRNTYSKCCADGRVAGCDAVTPFAAPPPDVVDLYEGVSGDSKHFLANIRSYNNAFAMVSMSVGDETMKLR